MSFFEFPNTRTYDNDLGWLIKNAKNADEAIKALQEWVNNTDDVISGLQQLLTDMSNGKLPPELANAIYSYIVTNFYDMVGDMIKMVFFGLTDNGYFVAYIPDSWDEIKFSTSGLDTDIPGIAYGHLILSY